MTQDMTQAKELVARIDGLPHDRRIVLLRRMALLVLEDRGFNAEDTLDWLHTDTSWEDDE